MVGKPGWNTPRFCILISVQNLKALIQRWLRLIIRNKGSRAEQAAAGEAVNVAYPTPLNP